VRYDDTKKKPENFRVFSMLIFTESSVSFSDKMTKKKLGAFREQETVIPHLFFVHHVKAQRVRPSDVVGN